MSNWKSCQIVLPPDGLIVEAIQRVRFSDELDLIPVSKIQYLNSTWLLEDGSMPILWKPTHWKKTSLYKEIKAPKEVEEMEDIKKSKPSKVEQRARRRKRQREKRLRKDEKETRKQWEANNPQKKKAHKILAEALKMGLIRQRCEICGDPKTDGHHPDYNFPLLIRWLCRKHHIAVHCGKLILSDSPPEIKLANSE